MNSLGFLYIPLTLLMHVIFFFSSNVKNKILNNPKKNEKKNEKQFIMSSLLFNNEIFHCYEP